MPPQGEIIAISTMKPSVEVGCLCILLCRKKRFSGVKAVLRVIDFRDQSVEFCHQTGSSRIVFLQKTDTYRAKSDGFWRTLQVWHSTPRPENRVRRQLQDAERRRTQRTGWTQISLERSCFCQCLVGAPGADVADDSKDFIRRLDLRRRDCIDGFEGSLPITSKTNPLGVAPQQWRGLGRFRETLIENLLGFGLAASNIKSRDEVGDNVIVPDDIVAAFQLLPRRPEQFERLVETWLEQRLSSVGEPSDRVNCASSAAATLRWRKRDSKSRSRRERDGRGEGSRPGLDARRGLIQISGAAGRL
jgi:hypothetical protein